MSSMSDTTRDGLREKITDICMRTNSVNVPMLNELEKLLNSEIAALIERLNKYIRDNEIYEMKTVLEKELKRYERS